MSEGVGWGKGGCSLRSCSHVSGKKKKHQLSDQFPGKVTRRLLFFPFKVTVYFSVLKYELAWQAEKNNVLRRDKGKATGQLSREDSGAEA